MRSDHYQVLGVSPDASGEAIRIAYAERIKAFRNALGNSEPPPPADLDALREAYRVLSSPELRAAYDRLALDLGEAEAELRDVAVPSTARRGRLSSGKVSGLRKGRLALMAGLWLLVAGALVFGGWYAWTNGLIPGNPRAATEEVMEPIVRRAAALKAQQQSVVCVGPELERVPPEIQGIPGIANRAVPGQHSLVLLLDTNAREQDVRERQLRQLGYFAKQGFFTETAIDVETDAGLRPARQYRLTWKGYSAMHVQGGSVPCFVVGHRDFSAIQQIEKRPEDVFGMAIYEVAYESVVRDQPAWVTGDGAKGLFPKLPGLVAAKRETVRLLRGNEGWITEMEAQMRAAAMRENSNGAAGYLKQFEEQLVVPPIPQASEVLATFGEYLNGDQWLGRGTVACLPLRLQRGGDDRDALADRTSYSVTYYDQAGRQEYQRTQMITALHALSALEAAGLATLEHPLPPAVVGGQKPSPAPAGVRFVLSSDIVQALGLNGSACIPVGRMKVEFLGSQYSGHRSAQILAYAKVGQTPDWVSKIAEHLPALRSVIDDGIPIVGTLVYGEDFRNGEKEKRWRVTSLNPSYPELAAPSVPLSLQGRLPLTTVAAKKVTRSGMVGLPLVAPVSAASSPAASVAVSSGIPAPTASELAAPAAKSAEKLPRIEGVAAPYAAGDLDVHAISVYEGNLPSGESRGFQQHPEGVIEIRLGKTARPAMLLLSSYEPNEWRVTLEPGANLEKVLAFGHHTQRVTINGKHRAEIITPTREAMQRVERNSSGLPRSMEANRLRDVADTVRAITGKPPATFQAEYRPKQVFAVSAATQPFALPAPTSVAVLGAGDVVLRGSSGDPVTTLEVKYGNAGAYTPAWASRAYSSGRTYFEGYMTLIGGLVSEPHANVGLALARSNGGILDESQDGYAVIGHGQQKIHRNGDVFGLALDLDAGLVYVRVNGEWITGEPGSGNGRALKKGREYVPYFYASAIGSGDKRTGQTSWTANFGASAFRHPLPKGYSSYDGKQKNPL
jgi:hypothetical protein